MTKEETIKRQIECEKAGLFDEHIWPPDLSLALPPDHFRYQKKGFWRSFSELLRRIFIVNPFSWWLNLFYFRTKVYGRKNLRGIKRSIVTCNHCSIFDNLAIKHALKQKLLFRMFYSLPLLPAVPFINMKRKKVRIVAAPFNNRSDKLGKVMRAGGMIPMGANFAAMKNFYNFVEDRLTNKKTLLVIYPEQALWWMYEKPRPFKDGAFKFAAKHNVPILPMFIAFSKRKKLDKEGQPRRKFHVFIMPPIYPDENKTIDENMLYLKDENYKACIAKYEEFYGIKLEYLTKDTKIDTDIQADTPKENI